MVAFAKAVGCEEGDGQLACLRQKTPQELLDHSMQPMPGAGGGFDTEWSFAAVIDGAGGVLPDSPRALFQRGEIAKVPYLLGSNNDEGTTFVFRATPLMNEAEYMADLEMRYHEAAADVYDMYPPSAFGGDVNAALARHVGDSTVVCSTHDTAVLAAKAGLKVFMYNFKVDWAVYPAVLKAGHASEISHVFGDPYLPMPDADSEAVGKAMNHYWATFAKTGDPNDSEAPAQWPAFAADADKRLQLDIGWEELDDFRTKECAFWNNYYKLD
jgi:para-nitrobenzyl esterase